MALPKVGDKVNLNRTNYIYASNGLWKGSDGSTKTKDQMKQALGTSTGAGSTKPATPATPAKAAGKWKPAVRYPSDIAHGTGDYVLFQFYDYKPPYDGTKAGNAPNQSQNQYVYKYNGAFDDGNGLAKANDYPEIIMYMPEDISASYKSNWGGRTFGPLAGMGLDLAGSVMNADAGGMSNAANTFGNEMKNITNGALPYIGATAVAAAMNIIPGMGGNISANDILASTRGEILNPNTEVLYSGPELRTFDLNFKMLARNKQESDDIRNICTTFKKASLAQGNKKSSIMIGVPKIVKVTFKHKNDRNKYITQYKCSAIGAVNINYTPDGSWATYTNSAPVAVGLKLSFQELKLVYSEDIDKGF